MKVDLHIERLILDGLPVKSADGPRVRRAVERELARLLASGGLLPEIRAGGALDRVRAGTVQLEKEQRPGQLGQQIARAVHGGIGKTR